MRTSDRNLSPLLTLVTFASVQPLLRVVVSRVVREPTTIIIRCLLVNFRKYLAILRTFTDALTLGEHTS
jgi:hypothetical protein